RLVSTGVSLASASGEGWVATGCATWSRSLHVVAGWLAVRGRLRGGLRGHVARAARRRLADRGLRVEARHADAVPLGEACARQRRLARRALGDRALALVGERSEARRGG